MHKIIGCSAISLFLMISPELSFSAQSRIPAKTEIDQMVSMCQTKISSVDNKASIFTYPAKPSFIKLKETQAWKKEVARIDKVKDYYLGILDQTKDWLKKNNSEIKSLPEQKLAEKSLEYVHNCNLYVDSMADVLYWFQGKTPPGGFKNGMSAKYFENQFSGSTKK